MYFPYLRGRQFELIALRELLEKQLMHDNIVPIVEPVKLSSTLNLTLKKFYNGIRKRKPAKRSLRVLYAE